MEEEEDGEYECIKDFKKRKKKLLNELKEYKSDPGPNEPKMYEAIQLLIVTLRKKNEYEEVFELVDEYVDIMNDVYFKCCILMEKGRTYNIIKKLDEGLECLQEAYSLVNVLPQRHTEKSIIWTVSLILKEMGDCNRSKVKPNIAYTFYRDSWYEVFENFKNELEREECAQVRDGCFKLIEVCILLGKTKEAIVNGMKTISFLKGQNSYKKDFSNIRSILIQKVAQCYYISGYHDLANILHLRCLQICPEEEEDLRNELVRDICMYFFHKQDYNKFEEYRSKLTEKDSKLDYCSQIFHSEELRRMWNKSNHNNEEKPICCFCCGKNKNDDTEMKLQKCSRCQIFFYCGRECQKRDWWAGHKHCCLNLLKL